MSFFGLGIPGPFGPFGKPVTEQSLELHNWVGWTIVILALLHALAALYHHYVLRDRVLVRMLPRGSREA
jgi:cytochrome b561